MAEHIEGALDQLQNILASEGGKKDLEGMLRALGGLGEGDKGAEGGCNMDAMMQMKNVMEQLRRQDDPRSRLLLALKPYLSPSRSAKLDIAIQVLSLGKLPMILKNMRR